MDDARSTGEAPVDPGLQELSDEEAANILGGYGIYIRPKGRVYSPG